MADSDYDYEEDASEDEYIGSRTTSTTRTQSAAGKRKARKEARKRQAWESSTSARSPEFEYVAAVEEANDGTIQQSVQEREEERKRKR